MASSIEIEMSSIDAEGLRNRSDRRQILEQNVKDADTLALARAGKKQILAVSASLKLIAHIGLMEKAPLWICQCCRLCLHLDEHVGRRINVS